MGLSAAVEIEGSSPHKLQIKSLISTQLNSSLPAYAPFNSQNSEKLPAQFVLNLSQPFPMLNTSINQIVNEISTEPATIKEYLTNLTANTKESVISLIARQELDLNRGPFNRSVDIFKNSDGVGESCDLKRHVYSIRLQEQCHTYHILENYLERPEGVYVSKIPFTHPTSIPSILKILRQQALFNFVIGSCIRRSNKSSNTPSNNNNYHTNNNYNVSNDDNQAKAPQESNIFDVIPVNLNNICILFEHPSKESLATLEIDLKTVSEPNCQLHALDKECVCSNEFATKVLQKCWSIPITLRAVLKKCKERRLALMEDENVRRERELQELIANNSAQQVLSFKGQDEQQRPKVTIMQSKFNNNSDDKPKSRDLNLLPASTDSKLSSNSYNSSDASNQTNQLDSGLGTSDRSNLLKKFSCKPKAKNVTQGKSQAGSKMLSLMLKRQNPSTPSSDDATVRPIPVKKPRVKGDPSVGSKIPSLVASMPKVISLDASSATKLTSKPVTKQMGNNQNISVSLLRSPNKLNPMPNSMPPFVPISVNLPTASSSKQLDPHILLNPGVGNSNFRVSKTQSNGNSGNCAVANNGKPRKSSIVAVLDRLVGSVTPEQQSNALQSASPIALDSASETNPKSVDVSKGSPQNSTKSKQRPPGDQTFAIKQGSLGSLKLTVTKTKPALVISSSSTSTTSTPSTSTSSSMVNATPNSTGTCQTDNKPSKPNTNAILGLGSTLNIRYTIPKISKTQPTTGSNQNNAVDNSGQAPLEAAPKNQDNSSTPSSTGNNSSAASSSNLNKRTSSTPFQRANNPSRVNSVSSSTHHAVRTTSNPLANAVVNRPSSTSASDGIVTNRISSSTNPLQMRQQMSNRAMASLQHLQPSSSSPGVSSSSDTSIQESMKEQAQPTTISDPSSPTESGQVEATEPPPLIPIDSLDEAQQATSPDTDQPDDASDRLSIIDSHDNLLDSAATTPKPSSVYESPNAVQPDSVADVSQSNVNSATPPPTATTSDII